MNHALGLSFALVLIVSGCRGEQFDNIRKLASAGETIICFGESLTEEVGAEPGGGVSHDSVATIGNAGAERRPSWRYDCASAGTNPVSVVNKNPRLVILVLGGKTVSKIHYGPAF